MITEHAIQQLGLQTGTGPGWLIQTPHPLTAAQINSARLTAAAAGMTVETKNNAPTSAEIINWATVFGIVLALGVLAMSVGLIRSETASDLRTLTATGASGSTRRTLTAATAGALGLLGAVLGTVAAYVAAIASRPQQPPRAACPSWPTSRSQPAGHPGRHAAGRGGGGWLFAGRSQPPSAISPSSEAV